MRARESHGMTKTPEYRAWLHIKNRCYDTQRDNYKDYGGRGITVCDRWKNSFALFYVDMGNKPTLKHQIDRINNDGNYEPNNCRWITTTENNRNRSNNKLTIQNARRIRRLYQTTDLTYIKIAKLYGVDESLIGRIIRNKSWIDNVEAIRQRGNK